MKANAIFTTLLLSILVLGGTAQQDLTSRAAQLCQEKSYSAALLTIEQAIQTPDGSSSAYTWYVRGFIHKEVYKANEAGLRNSSHRKESVVSFQKSLSLDRTGEYEDMTKTALKYVATTYLNDALLMTREITPDDDRKPLEVYDEFRRIMLIVNPGTDFTPYNKEINRKLAQANYRLWESDIRRTRNLEKAGDYYNQILQANPTDCEANYNMAILKYNSGVHKIRRIDGSTDMVELIVIQDECIRLFRAALPFAEASLRACPQKLEYHKAVMFIHRALGDEEKYNELRMESEELIRLGKIKN